MPLMTLSRVPDGVTVVASVEKAERLAEREVVQPDVAHGLQLADDGRLAEHGERLGHGQREHGPKHEKPVRLQEMPETTELPNLALWRLRIIVPVRDGALVF